MIPKQFDLTDRKHRYIRISSEDKAFGTNSQFEVNLPPTGQSIDTISGYMVKYAACPNIFPNVPEYANDLVIDGGAPFAIPAGQYTISEFETALKTAIDIEIGPDTVVVTLGFNDILNFTFSAPHGFTLVGSTIADIIGLTADIPAGLSIDMQNPVNLTGESEVYIHSRTLNQSGLTEAQGNFSVVDVIPLNTTQYGAIASIVYPDHELSKINFQPYETNKTFRTIDIVLRNRQGRVLVLPSNFNFTMMLRAYHELG